MENKEHTSPDYSRYTIEELEDVLANIDRVKYAQRFADAKAMLAQKLRESPIISETEQADKEAAQQPVKWSERHILTRTVGGALFVVIFSAVPGFFIEFMAAKSWLQQTNFWIWGTGSCLGTLWVLALIKDEKFAKSLLINLRGKFAVMIMPVIFLMFSFITIDNTIPLVLHNLIAPQPVRYTMQYRKASSSKHCSHKVEIVETKDLDRGQLCMSASMRNSLPETGDIIVIGTRSQFGLVVKGFKPI